ncbi:Transmembrane emp24 domain containing protein 9 [Dissostichus eleginoides]|uniref:Transmembrane emp24 domain containing protein 9 n=1 Tax=Dissostichus eleginoides TaxID=100907 RepID=A0AAD9CL82_DISEL|nr:Transmembrane emp24 domain containing protein 9 [Dissostichus eleginoides]KAK1904541.1 Transmembrane emp24 domain containing protein 9 [Dissostichus eleginoides]
MAAVKLLTVVLLHFFFTFVSSLYFHMGDTERKCFMEKIPNETMLIGNYRTRLFDGQRDEYLPVSQNITLSVQFKDPNDKLVLSRSHGSEGSFRFRSKEPGGYQICLQANCSQHPLPAGVLLAVHLDLRAAGRTNNYAEIAALLRVRQLMEQVLQIQQEQKYQRLMERDSLEVTENTNMWIFWWPVARSLYVVFIIIWHTKSW